MAPRDRSVRVFTIGHSARTLREFVELLKEHGIRVVVDVRRFPKSRRYPHFERSELERALEGRGISYVWLGEKLGGFRERGYEAYMDTEDFRRGLMELLRIIEGSEGRVALMCRERLWFKCHRRFISSVLVWLGYRVVHIVDRDRKYVHRWTKEVGGLEGYKVA